MIDVLGWIAAGMVLLSLARQEPVRLHVLSIAACLLFVFYDVALSLVSMMAMNVVLMVISLVQIRRLRRTAAIPSPPGIRVVRANSRRRAVSIASRPSRIQIPS